MRNPLVPEAQKPYTGDLLDIGEVLKTDYARFLKISRQEAEESHIELSYPIYAPIKKTPSDLEI